MNILNRAVYNAMNHSFMKVVKLKLFLKFNSNRKYSDLLYLTKLGKICLGYDMNLKKPETYNEKINWLKLHYRNKNMIQCVDKIGVDEYVKSKGYAEILVPKYGQWKSIDEIDLSKLPNQFVLKTNHDSGGVLKCLNKTKIKKSDLRFLDRHLKNDFSSLFLEWPYKYVTRKIFAEKYLKNKNDTDLIDYKFHCSYGKVLGFIIYRSRSTKLKVNYYDQNGNELLIQGSHPKSKKKLIKDSTSKKMMKIAENLSLEFPYVRVDLYNCEGKIYFGEMTFFPAAGLQKYNLHDEMLLGKYIPVENINKEFLV